MRLSIKDNDPGYSSFAFGAKVYLDGEEVSRCFTADEEMGIAQVYITDDNGNLMLNHEQEEVLSRTLRGKVAILLSSNIDKCLWVGG